MSVEPEDIPASIIAQLQPGAHKTPISLEEAVREMVGGLRKSEKTPMYSVTHHPLGVEGLWHYEGLQLPAYIQNVAKGIMESGHSRAEAIPMAINAIKRWAAGEGHVHPEVRAASRKALAEWDRLKATHNKTKEGR